MSELRIRITKNDDWNWYRVGEVFAVRDLTKYEKIGVQVERNGTTGVPDVVAHGHYEILE